MTLRTTFTAVLATGAAVTLAFPAFADCADQLTAFDGQLADARQHEQSSGSADGEAAALQDLDEKTQSEVVLLINEARAAVQGGDEAACMARLREARELIAER